MMRSLYIAKTGMDASQFRLDVTSNNLANGNTKGFKRSNAIFEDLYYQTLRQPGSQIAGGGTLPTGLQVGTGAAAVASARIHTQGNLVRTEQTFDLAVVGDGFFRVALADGTIAYSRNGEFKRNQRGQIVNSAGYLLDPAVTIPSDATQVSVSASGVVQYFLKGNPDPVVAGNIQTASFVNPQGLESLGENLYLPTAASGAAIEGDPGVEGRGTISQGYLEDSNVNVTEELINMIQAQRAFEMNSKAIKTADEMLQRVAQL